MPNSGLKGPYKLSAENVALVVTKTSPGAYALGRTDHEGPYRISYVGRSDGDVAARLKQHAGNYPQFKFDYFDSPKAAFEKECALYHDFGETKLDNAAHPDRPNNSGWKCPRCTLFG